MLLSALLSFWAVSARAGAHDRGFLGRPTLPAPLSAPLIGLSVCSPFLGSSNVNL